MFCRRHRCPYVEVGLELGVMGQTVVVYRCVKGGHLRRSRRVVTRAPVPRAA